MIKTQDVKIVQVQDWDNLVKETYGRAYSFQQQDGCKDRGTHELIVDDSSFEDPYENDTVLEALNYVEMGVSFKAWLARDPEQPLSGDEDHPARDSQWAIDMWWERNFYPDVDMVASDLHRRGLLPAGDYMIIIDW